MDSWKNQFKKHLFFHLEFEILDFCISSRAYLKQTSRWTSLFMTQNRSYLDLSSWLQEKSNNEFII